MGKMTSLITQPPPDIPLIDPLHYTTVLSKMRQFFIEKGFREVATQSRLSILAACEDPTTIATFNYAGQVWPLPQTGQMWLEYELLKSPHIPGFFCTSTSFRNEPNPVPGRHDKIFPMFEFELRGGVSTLIALEQELLRFLGFKDEFHIHTYKEMQKKYGVQELEHEHETRMNEDYGSLFFLTRFPNTTSPFWNMKQCNREPGIAHKVDVIMHGIETIGSAERSCSVPEMREQFYNISNGNYARLLFAQFTRQRVENELETFLAGSFVKRCGGGIGMTRMIRAMLLEGLLPPKPRARAGTQIPPRR